MASQAEISDYITEEENLQGIAGLTSGGELAVGRKGRLGDYVISSTHFLELKFFLFVASKKYSKKVQRHFKRGPEKAGITFRTVQILLPDIFQWLDYEHGK